MQAYAIGKHTDTFAAKGATHAALIAAVVDEPSIGRICGLLSRGKSDKAIFASTGLARFWPKVERERPLCLQAHYHTHMYTTRIPARRRSPYEFAHL
jgi:hypothetical protein